MKLSRIFYVVVFFVIAYYFTHHLTARNRQSVDKQDDNIDEWLNQRRLEYERRKDILKKICATEKDLLKKQRHLFEKDDYAILIDANTKFLYCAHPKAASSTIKQYLSKLAKLPKQSTNAAMHNIVSEHYAIENVPEADNITSVNDLNQYLKRNKILSFTFVRHPMDRLVSAYENKFLYAQDPTYFIQAILLKKNFTLFANKVINDNKRSNIDIHWT